MSFFEKAMTIVFGDNEEDSQCGETNLESIRRKQLELIRNHFRHRKDFKKIKYEFDRRGAWIICANHESGNAHPRYPYFQQPVTGDMTITDGGDVYEYTKPRRGINGFEFRGHTRKEEMLCCYLLKFVNSKELLTIPKEILVKGASVLPGESLADYYKNNPDISLEKVYKQRQNEERQRKK